jgi:DNA-binding response OmpR family regulator
MKILVIEDDLSVSMTLKQLLSRQNYAVDTVAEGKAGLEMVEAFEYDLILLDIKLPDRDGVEICKQIRERGYWMPILILTGIDEREEKALALNTGADDYVVKPFDSLELIARVQALLRRGKVTKSPVLEWGSSRLDPSTRQVSYGETPLLLTAKEYAILELLLREPARVWSQGDIVERIWASDRPRGEEAVRYHVKELRKKLQGAGAPFDFVETIYGIGYRLNPRCSRGNEEDETTTVLVVTEAQGLPESIRQWLGDRNTRAIAIDHPAEYWLILENEPIDLVILDMEASGGDPLELCRATKGLPRWKTLPIIALLPNVPGSSIEKVFEAGADDFVSKPIVGPELLARVMIRIALGKRDR